MSHLDRTAEERDILRRAGMSERSELTPAEAAGLRVARFALAEQPAMTREQIYRLIRPRRDDDD